MRNLTVLILGLLFSISCFEAKSQKLEYDIIWLGKIGKLHINKTQKEAYSFIEINSEVKVPFYKFNWITTSTLKDGQLQSSNYSQLLNNKKREYTEIDFVAVNKWQIIDDSGQSELIDIKLHFNVSNLYYEEPVNEKYIFSERFGKPIELENKGNGHYRLLLPDKNYCDYFYEEGVCTNVVVKNGARKIKFVLFSIG